eukprot:Sspe_Gene.115465::Locus_102995_Transcript_1_1_Confidence_1.000_Length_828::g.115465::m.115465
MPAAQHRLVAIVGRYLSPNAGDGVSALKVGRLVKEKRKEKWSDCVVRLQQERVTLGPKTIATALRNSSSLHEALDVAVALGVTKLSFSNYCALLSVAAVGRELDSVKTLLDMLKRNGWDSCPSKVTQVVMILARTQCFKHALGLFEVACKKGMGISQALIAAAARSAEGANDLHLVVSKCREANTAIGYEAALQIGRAACRNPSRAAAETLYDVLLGSFVNIHDFPPGYYPKV